MPSRFNNTHFGRSYVHLLFFIISITLTVFIYSNVLNGDPQFDDEEYLFHNPLLKSPANFAGKNVINLFVTGQRPLTVLTFALNYHFGGENTYPYHLVNLAIHIINGVLLFFFLSVTLRQPLLKEKYSKISGWLPAIVVLIFLIHPIQTQAVSYIVQRGESLASMFYLISMLSFASSSRAATPFKALLYVIFVAGFILGLGSKQIAVTLPLTALLYGIFFFGKEGRFKNLLLPSFMLLAGLFVSMYALISLDSSSAGFSLHEFTAYEYFLTEFRVVWTYLRMLFLPVGQSIDHLYPVSRSVFTLVSLFSLITTLSLLLCAVFLRKRFRAESFFIFWFFIILMPTSTIVPLKEVMVEHRLYLPSVGIYFIMSSLAIQLFLRVRQGQSARRTLALATLINLSFIILLGMATYKRNVVWSDRLLMWKDVVRKYPESARGYHNLGNSYMIENDYKNALRAFLTSMNLAVANVELYYNVGLIFEGMGMKNLARDFFAFFIAYSGGENRALINRLSVRYEIEKGVDVVDIVKLKEKAINVYNMMYISKTGLSN